MKVHEFIERLSKLKNQDMEIVIKPYEDGQYTTIDEDIDIIDGYYDGDNTEAGPFTEEDDIRDCEYPERMYTILLYNW